MIEDMVEIYAQIEKMKSFPNVNVTSDFDDNLHEDYYAINFTYESGNTVLHDYAIMYVNYDFNKEEVMENLYRIESMAAKLFA